MEKELNFARACSAENGPSFYNAESKIVRIQQELEPKEKLLWSASPDANRMMLQAFGLWFFAIPWTVFSLFWESMVCLMPSDGLTKPVMLIFGTPFILIGFAMLSAPFFAKLKGGQTLYVITDRRVLIAEFGKTLAIRSYLPSEIGRIRRKDLDGGKADISFIRSVDSEGSISHDGFTGVPDGRTAEAYLLDLKARAHEIEPPKAMFNFDWKKL